MTIHSITVLALGLICALVTGCREPVANPEWTLIERDWSPVDTAQLGRTRTGVAERLGFATCSDSHSDETNYPGEEIVTFSHDGLDYRVHFRGDDVVRAFQADAVGPGLASND